MPTNGSSVGNEVARSRALAPRLPGGLAFVFVIALAGCSALPPFNRQPVVARGPQPPAVIGSGSEKGVRPCPQPLIVQTQWLARNMARLRLGFSKLQVVGVVGDPAHAETFQLSNGAVIEVLFYHTAQSICRVQASLGNMAEGLMPLVFQDDRLIGYGPNYYRDFIVPMLRPNVVESKPVADFMVTTEVGAALPQPRVLMRDAEPLRAAPARTGRWQQEDLPTPPGANSVPPSGRVSGNGYTGDMQTEMRPVGYYESGYAGGDAASAGPARVGRGEPLQ